MGEDPFERRLIPALPLTIASDGGAVWLVAGEDLRWTIEGPAVERWLPVALEGLDGDRTLNEVIETLDAAARPHARDVLRALEEERVLIEVSTVAAPADWGLEITGDRLLTDAIRARLDPAPNDGAGVDKIVIHAQRTLDYSEARRIAAEVSERGEHYLWVTLGPRTRAFVSPVFAPGRGPCVGCLHGAFRRLSPIPELYDVLAEHSTSGGEFTDAEVAPEFLDAVASHIAWKMALLREPLVPSAPYRLHVLEWVTGEISSHPVRVDPDCQGDH